MANNAFLVLLVLGAVSIGALGGYFVFLGMHQEQFAQLAMNESMRAPLISKVMQTWVGTAGGTVESRNDRVLILQNQGERLSFKIQEGAPTQLLSVQNGEKQVKIIDLEDLRPGDLVEIRVSVDRETGTLGGTSVTVFQSQ
jgi:hypothetical protein